MQLISILLVSLLFGQSSAATASSISERCGSSIRKIGTGICDLVDTIQSGLKFLQNLLDSSVQTLKSLTEPAWDAITRGLAELWEGVTNYLNEFKEQFRISLNKLNVLSNSFFKNNIAANSAIKVIIITIENHQRLIQESLYRIDIRYNKEISKISTIIEKDVEYINSRLVEINKKNKGDPIIAKLVTSTNEKLKECVSHIIAPIQKFYNNTVELANPGLTQIESVVNKIDECKYLPSEEVLKCVEAAKAKLPNSEDTKQIVKSMERRIFDTNWKDLFNDSCLVNIKMKINYLIDEDAEKIAKFIDSKNSDDLGKTFNAHKFTTSISENSNPALFTPKSISTNDPASISHNNIELINLGKVSNINTFTSSTPEFTEPTPTDNIASMATNETLATSLDNIESTPINLGADSNINSFTSSTSEFTEKIPTDNIASMSTNETLATSLDNVEPTPINLGAVSNRKGFNSSTSEFTRLTSNYNIKSMVNNRTVQTSVNHREPKSSDNVQPESPIVTLLRSINDHDNVASTQLNKFESTSATNRRELNVHSEVSKSILKFINSISWKVKIYLTIASELYNGFKNKISSARTDKTENKLKVLEATFKDAIEPVTEYDAKLKKAAIELNNCNELQSLNEFMKCSFKIVCNANITDEGNQILTAMIDKLNSIVVN